MKKMYKVFVTVPESHTDIVISAMAKAGAGVVGTYTHCAYITKGTGNYMAEVGSNPYIGEVGKMSKEPEDKVEMICEIKDLESVIEAINSFHPYEKPTVDVVEIKFFTKE